MRKWYGKVGFVISEETTPGVYLPTVTERKFFGEILSNTSKWSPTGSVNDNLDVSIKISIMATPFALQNCSTIKYIEYMGALWEVTSISPESPRLILTVGGVYNGQTPSITE